MTATSPSFLYYNCQDPVRVLQTQVIVPSDVHSGVSMSEWDQLGSHGPFKIAFQRTSWFSKFIQVRYWEFAPKVLRRKDLIPDYYVQDQWGRKYVNAERYNDTRYAYTQLVTPVHFHRIWKENFMFKDEREWWCPHGIGFDMIDVVAVEFMMNAPCILSKRRVNSLFQELRSMKVEFRKVIVDDPYLINKEAV